MTRQSEQTTVQTILEFSVMTTSVTKLTNTSWPYAIIPDFERKSALTRSIIESISMALSIIVPEEERETYENWTTQNLDWYYEGMEIAGREPVPQPSTFFVPTPDGPVYDNTTGPYVPLWQLGPPPSNPTVNLNSYRSRGQLHYHYVMDTKRRARSRVVDLNYALENAQFEPISIFYEPVFRNFEDQEVVALFQVVIPWRKYFENVLHDDAVGMRCVVKSTCDQAFTFEVNGPKAVFLGEEDVHDPKYDYLEQVTGLTVDLDAIQAGNTTSELGVNCAYTLHVYPSDKLRAQYESNTPVLFTLAVLAIFFFSSLVFILYDCLVQRRQVKVMSSAERTDAIVSSLFPSQFRDQMMQNSEDEARASKGLPVLAKSHLRSFMSNPETAQNLEKDDEDLFLTKPVADLFPHAVSVTTTLKKFARE